MKVKLFNTCCDNIAMTEKNNKTDFECMSCKAPQKPKIALDRDIEAIYKEMRLNGLTARSMAFKYHLTPLEAKYIVKRGAMLAERRARIESY